MTITAAQLTTVLRDTHFTETVNVTTDDHETIIDSWTVSEDVNDSGISVSGTTVTGQYKNQFNEQIHYITKGSSDLIETPNVITNINFMPHYKDIIKFGTDGRANVTATYSVDVEYTDNAEDGLTLTRTESLGTLSAVPNSERGDDVVMACDIRFPATTPSAGGVLWEMGGSLWGAYVGFSTNTGSVTFRCRAGAGLLQNMDSTTDNAAIVDISDFPTDGEIHRVVWEIRVNPGRVRLWIDGNFKGESNTALGGPLRLNRWGGGNPGGYTVRNGSVPSGESLLPWSTYSSLTDASGLRIYVGELLTASDSETISVSQIVENDMDAYANWLTDYIANRGVYGDWSNPFYQQFNLSDGLLTHHEYSSSLLNTQHGYSLYIPYNNQMPTTRLPVIYRLHGKGGSESSAANFVQYVNDAIDAGVIRPVAVVLINGGKHSFYSNSKNGQVPVEDVIMTELIPHIESTYAIGGERDLRLLEGFSMGGFGALKLAFTYPEKFKSVSILGGALLSEDWPPWVDNEGSYVIHFGSDFDYFISQSPTFLASQNYNNFDGLGIRMVVGLDDATKRYNYSMRDHLNNLGVNHEFEELAGVGHNTQQYYYIDNYGSFVFHEQMMNS